MNIAIVEDDQNDRLWLSEKLKQYMKEKELTYTLYPYRCAEDFVQALESITFSIVFMDIYLDEMTGVEASAILRQKDKECRLIFLTVTEEFWRQGFSLNASHYLTKPADDAQFLEAMENCRLSPQYAVPYLDFISEGVSIHLNTGKILYITLHGRTVYIHTPQQVFKVSSSFSQLTKPLTADPRFLLSIQGVLINMDHISGAQDSLFILKNGEQLPINLRNRKQVLQNYRNYIFDKIGTAL